MLEDFSGCESFRNLRNFAGCEISQPTKFRRLRIFADCEISQPGTVHLLLLQLFVSCNSPFDVLEIKFSNLLSQAINGH